MFAKSPLLYTFYTCKIGASVANVNDLDGLEDLKWALAVILHTRQGQLTGTM